MYSASIENIGRSGNTGLVSSIATICFSVGTAESLRLERECFRLGQFGASQSLTQSMHQHSPAACFTPVLFRSHTLQPFACSIDLEH